MYLQKVISKKNQEISFFVAFLKVTEENSRIPDGSVSQRYGYTDPEPDPYKIVTDPQH
jgi:hypothetical protein